MVVEESAPMEAIYIPQLASALERTEQIDVQEYLPGLETLMPVQGKLRVTHHGSYLEVTAQAETIVTLSCDRCLKQYNYRLKVNASEMIWLQEPIEEDFGQEKEIPFEDFVETLPPNGYFRPGEWLYEQLCLEIPQRQLCDQDCGGIPVEATEAASQPATDRRWASLESLKGRLN
jgi:uncharacterized protein